MQSLIRRISFLMLAGAAVLGQAAPLPEASPEEVGMSSRIDRGQSEWPGSPGEYFWAGYAGTYFWIDPEEELVPVLMTQEPLRRQTYRILVRNLVYQSILK